MLCEDGGPATVDRLRRHAEEALAERFDLDGEPVRIGASVGAVLSDGATDADELIRRADEAMYAARKLNRRLIG